MELLEGVQPLARADELYRHARHGHYGDCRSAARVAVQLGQHEPGEPDAVMELLGDGHGVLPCHGVHDEQGFDGLDGVPDGLELRHQVVVDLEAARRVDDGPGRAGLGRTFDSSSRGLRGIAPILAMDGDVDLPAQGLELLDGRWAP